MAEVKGIGGVFIHAEDPDRLAGWYRDVLGIELTASERGKGHCRVFATRDVESGIERANPVFAIHRCSEKLATTGRGFVLNLRVDDLRSYLEDLRARDVESEPLVEDPYGLFSAISDLDGNRIELYEERFPDGEPST